MENLARWLRRLNDKAPSEVARMTLRLFVPGHSVMDIDGWLLTTEQPTAVPPGFRSGLPESMALLAYVDEEEFSKNVAIQHQLSVDIAAAMSVALERRIDIPFEIALQVQGGNTVTFMPYGSIVDRVITGPLPNDSRSAIAAAFQQIYGLSKDDVAVIGSAASMFHGALLLYDRDIRSAYTLLVAGIETLSRKYGQPPSNWGSWEYSDEWDRFAAKYDLSNEQHDGLRARLMNDKQLRLKATFRSYASSRLAASFWDRPWNEWMYTLQVPQGVWEQATSHYTGQIRDFLTSDRSALGKALGSSYDLRSSYIHKGKWVDPIDLAFDPRSQVDMRGPLPFAILRSILRELIITEMRERSQPTVLPDVKLYRIWKQPPK